MITLPQVNRFKLLFSAGRTVRLIGALYQDERVPRSRKVLFILAIGLLACALLVPDLLGETFLSTVLPFIGTVLGIPLDAGLDWATFIVLLPTLLSIFPRAVVQEHYQRLFAKDYEKSPVALPTESSLSGMRTRNNPGGT